MVSHTPGPWSALISQRAGNFHGAFSVVAESEFVICSRAGVPNRSEESNANARLIAAAPDLLAALNLICQNYGPAREDFLAGDTGERGYQEACAVFNLAEVAIAKAEGR